MEPVGEEGLSLTHSASFQGPRGDGDALRRQRAHSSEKGKPALWENWFHMKKMWSFWWMSTGISKSPMGMTKDFEFKNLIPPLPSTSLRRPRSGAVVLESPGGLMLRTRHLTGGRGRACPVRSQAMLMLLPLLWGLPLRICVWPGNLQTKPSC